MDNKIILQQPFSFDPTFYVESYEDVQEHGNPAEHFLTIGYRERRYGSNEHLRLDMLAIEKSGAFDAKLFQSRFGVRKDSLRYYLLNWQFENLIPNDIFDNQFIEQYYYRTLGEGENPFAFYCRHINKDWVFPNYATASAAVKHLRSSKILAGKFDEELHAPNRQSDPLVYHCTEGFRALETLSDQFDTRAYMQQYPDIAAVCINPLRHYIEYGSTEGRHSFSRNRHVILDGRPFDPSKKTIAIVSHEASRSGAPIVGINLARCLSDDYNIVTLLLRAGALLDDFVSVSQIVVVLGDQPGDLISGLSDVLSSYDICAAILNSAECAKCLPLLVNESIPVVSLIHEFAQYIWHLNYLDKAIALSDAVVFPAEVVKAEAMKELARLGLAPSHPNNTYVRPQGQSVLPPHRSDTKLKNLDLLQLLRSRPDRPLVVLGAGYVQPRKGVDLFIEAARLMKRDLGTPCLFVWVGSNYKPYEDMTVSVYLANQIEQSDLTDSFLFIDEVPSLDELWPMVDAFFMSSRLDPFPNVALDAIAANVPVICFQSATGIAELADRWPDRVAALSYGDCRGAADALLRLGRAEKLTPSTELNDFLSFEYYADFIDGLIKKSEMRQKQKVATVAALLERGFDATFFDETAPAWLKYVGFGISPDSAGKAKVAVAAAANGICVGLLDESTTSLVLGNGKPKDSAFGRDLKYVSALDSGGQSAPYSLIVFTNSKSLISSLADLLFVLPGQKLISIVSGFIEERDLAPLKGLIGSGDLQLHRISYSSDPRQVAEALRRRHLAMPCLHLLADGSLGTTEKTVPLKLDETVSMSKTAVGALETDHELQCLFMQPNPASHVRHPNLKLRCDDVEPVGSIVERLVVGNQAWLRSDNPNIVPLISSIYQSYLTLGDTDLLFHRLCAARSPGFTAAQCAIVGFDRNVHTPMVDVDYGRVKIAAHSKASHRREPNRAAALRPIRRHGTEKVTLIDRDLQEARMIWPVGTQLDWRAVDVKPGLHQILVHPLTGETTIAALHNSDSRPIIELSASIYVDNQDANEIEFGIAVVHRRKSYNDPVSLIKEWHRLSFDQDRRINATIEIQDDESTDILFATRMADNGDSRLAWAYFTDILVKYAS